MMNIPLVIDKILHRTFRLASQKKASLDVSNFRIPYGNGQMMELHLDEIDTNILILFGLDRLDEYKMYVNNVEDLLIGVDPK